MHAHEHGRFRLPRKRWAFAVAAVAALAIAVPVAWATFSDVPPSNPFYDDINAIQGAGITQGCGGGNFCPNDNITRQAEAAFVHRGLPRVGTDGIIASGLSAGPDTIVMTKNISVGGVAGGTQFVLATATVSLYVSGTASCGGVPCYFKVYLAVDGSQINDSDFVTINDGASGVVNAVSTTGIAQVSTGATHTIDVHVQEYIGSTPILVYGNLSAITAPFGSSGTSSFSPQRISGSAPGISH